MVVSTIIHAQVKADFSASSVQGCPPVNITFSDNSQGPVFSYFWDFGNGNTSTSKNPSAIYITPGKYTVSLTVKDISNNTSIEKRTSLITIFKSPTANASTSKKIGCIGDIIDFKDLSAKGDGNIVAWKWDFGDGNISNTQNPSHAYKSAGTYSIRLIATDVNGCEHNVTLNKHIKINSKPDPTFTISAPFSCKAPHATSFTAQSSAIGLTYNWNYGDGKGGQGKKPSHTYQNKGSFKVSLEVIDNLGCKSQSSNAVTISNLVPKIFSSKTTTCIDEYINFVASVSPKLSNVTYEWDLGDGRTVTGSAFSHRYKTDGLFKVTLKATTTGCTGTIVKNNYIRVRKNPERDITISDTIICDRTKPINFTDNSKDIATRLWTFSNGEKSPRKSNNILFNSGGDYLYTLEIKDKYGCTNKFTGNVKVSEIKADFITSEFTVDSFKSLSRKRPLYGKCTPHLLELEENIFSFYKVAKFSWDMSDGNIISNLDASHTYKEVDTVLHGWLWAEDIYGCKDSIDFYVELGDSTYPNFTPDKWEVCNGDTINFTNESFDSLNITKVIWGFGKRDYHTFNVYKMKPDSFEVKLTTYHNNCFNDTIIRGFKIKGPYIEIKTKYNPCSRDSILLWTYGCEYDSLVWVDENDKVLSYDTILKVPPISGNKYYVKAISDIGCDQMDSIILNLTDLTDLDVSWPEITECAPIKADFSLNPGSLHSPKWIFSDGDTFLNFEAKHLFKKAGTYTISVEASASGKCNGFKRKSFIVPGVIVKGSVVSIDTCLPFNIELYDSTYAPNRSNKYYWVINETDTIHHTAFKTNYYAQSQSRNGKINIELVGTDDSSCSSSLPFEINAGGPFADIFNYNTYLCDSIYTEVNLLNKSDDIIFISWKHDGKEIGNQPILNSFFPYNKKNIVTVTLADSYGCRTSFSKRYIQKKVLMQISPPILQEASAHLWKYILITYLHPRVQLHLTNGTLEMVQNPIYVTQENST